MGNPQKTHAPQVSISISDQADIGELFTRFEWASFINGGYMVYAKMSDPYFNTLKNIATREYLTEGRSKETDIKFTIKWAGSDRTTDRRKAFITDLKSRGTSESGTLEFTGIDPPSFYLNEGTADGRVYRGNVSSVIRQVVNDFAPAIVSSDPISPDITETIDNPNNVWYMMRQDPKTFIISLLDWAAGVTPKRTHWIVASVDDRLIIKEQAAIKPIDFGIYHVNRNGSGAKDVREYEMLSNNFISQMQAKLVTSGISSISGEFFDKITDHAEQEVVVTDNNTANKVNVDITSKQGFKKPDKPWATSIMSIPEHSAGDLGVPYSRYIDGRARNLFLKMLGVVMRLKIRVTGEPLLHDSSQLGVATVTIGWSDMDNEPYFLQGRWLIYGFHHIVTRENWWTDLYLARLDHDALAKKV